MRRQQKKKPTAQHAMTLQKQAFQNIKTPNFPKHRRKALFRNTNISKFLTGQKSGQKSRTAQDAIRLQKQAFQKIKHKILQNAERRHFFNNKYFQIGTSKQPVHNVSLKKPYFYKGNTLSKSFRGQVPRAQIQVCVSAKLSSWLGGGQFVTFGLFCCCHTFPLKCLFL